MLTRKILQNLSLNIPNLLSISRLFLVFPLILFLEIDRPFYVFILIIIGGLTDYFDGLIARKFNLKTRLGAILDPLSDKVFYLIPLVFLCKNNLIPFWSLTLILFRELIISSLRNLAKDGLPASQLGKFKTFFFFISVITFFSPLKIGLLDNLALVFYWMGFLLTFFTLFGYLRIKKNPI
ncbi:CDP-diacylglycerol--glycerol-3-phosphate 3-phosphatidyltransferase [Prochlorococcus marinus str. MU1404]|uniref:CDP-diacylglycerol--glycerol-3-phosphate 3-phosphatidyltransferase n=1 Tax=Prochlorococcus marinus TaxID=1219 RepID=UPI001AD9C6D1|nr:CDP-diacylglycerol--glycerol-3-phosphate 3-phosphatidyltransferase [Prochlorococcus marinus]MBO8230158.1 CDP-diacylglycerol--glycerol-3-phosphate 3-phosphatidyltransferase [Prochlorococcus marinus XMU1404]MBW3073068.1 CDP-diacylglycerol--glycerol-3-phosphate 3-phosphatidyltransferase [Prochlorococcus marinus str. MU1404]MCR8545504.1 CDP-diacylglycerol--glycerol-3-phosphate 3-phosphatidyltransferase [Prochlorococcus marinus CUG1432]